MNKATKKKKYLQICRILDEINRQANFCDIKKENNITTCVKSREEDSGYYIPNNTLCCTGCSNFTKNGCKAKSISCKMNYCFFGCGPKYCGLIRNLKQALADTRRNRVIKIIREYAKKHEIPIFEIRASMNTQFKLIEMLNNQSFSLETIDPIYNWRTAKFK